MLYRYTSKAHDPTLTPMMATIKSFPTEVALHWMIVIDYEYGTSTCKVVRYDPTIIICINRAAHRGWIVVLYTIH